MSGRKGKLSGQGMPTKAVPTGTSPMFPLQVSTETPENLKQPIIYFFHLFGIIMCYMPATLQTHSTVFTATLEGGHYYHHFMDEA